METKWINGESLQLITPEFQEIYRPYRAINCAFDWENWPRIKEENRKKGSIDYVLYWGCAASASQPILFCRLSLPVLNLSVDVNFHFKEPINLALRGMSILFTKKYESPYTAILNSEFVGVNSFPDNLKEVIKSACMFEWLLEPLRSAESNYRTRN